ncbi:hypothetical protein BH23CHL2_BH23CHL2_29100 [soil metagenome]
MTREPLDTRVTNGRFVGPDAPASSILTIHDGKIVDAPGEDVWRTVNASGHLVLPGLIQPSATDLDSALTAIRGGVTTAIASIHDDSTSCLDAVAISEVAIQIIEIDGSNELSDREWDLLGRDEPVHVQAAAGSGFPIIHFLYHEGHIKRSLPLHRLAALTSGNIARELGIFPQKGSFAAGSDGDVVVFDPKGDDPYSDIAWPGRVIFSLLRGSILLYNGQIHTSAGDGMRVR